MSTINKKADAEQGHEAPLDTEKLLLERLRKSSSEEDYFRWMLFIVGFYRGIDNCDAAIELLQSFIDSSKDRGQLAHCHLALGQIATDERRLEAALKHFNAALGFSPNNGKIAYVLHNNIGYCLNQLARYAESEHHCRTAIRMDWMRASAYRNLGVSLQGQGKLVEAAWFLVEAVKAESSDDRARKLLQEILESQPEMAVHYPWILDCLHSEAHEWPDLPPV